MEISRTSVCPVQMEIKDIKMVVHALVLIDFMTQDLKLAVYVIIHV